MTFKYQLTLNNVLRYMAEVFGDGPIVYRPPHGNDVKSTYGGEHERILRLADGLLSHEKWGERPVAFIVPKPGASVSEGEIMAHLQRYVDAGKIPKWRLHDKVVIMNELPMTGTGKIDKKILREKYKNLLIEK